MKLRPVIQCTLLMTIACGLGLAAQQGTPQQNGQPTLLPPAPQMSTRAITEQDLLAGLKDQTRWLTFSGEYNGQRHSPLTQLTPQNIGGLVPQWIFQTDIAGFPGRGIETTPLVIDGVMYATGNNNQASAPGGSTRSPCPVNQAATRGQTKKLPCVAAEPSGIQAATIPRSIWYFSAPGIRTPITTATTGKATISTRARSWRSMPTAGSF